MNFFLKKKRKLRKADKDPAEKSGFDFIGGAVLTGELGAGARHE
jgi:hypothetical protein